MTTDYRLRLTLLSDATFGRGDGVAGVVDAEIQHDQWGFPYVGGRALKGLLGAECADILYALQQARPDQKDRWNTTANRLFGDIGAALQGAAVMRVGSGQLPADLRAAVAQDIRLAEEKRDDPKYKLTRAAVLESWTAIRRQTAMDPETGAPQQETLRAMRVILRNTEFESSIRFSEAPAPDDLALLAACIKATRRGGTGRNRGRGRLRAELLDASGAVVTDEHFAGFQRAVNS